MTLSPYVWRAHAIARERQARHAYRDSRLAFLRRGIPGARDGYFTDAMADRIRWLAYRDLVEGVRRAERLLEAAEAAA